MASKLAYMRLTDGSEKIGPIDESEKTGYRRKSWGDLYVALEAPARAHAEAAGCSLSKAVRYVANRAPSPHSANAVETALTPETRAALIHAATKELGMSPAKYGRYRFVKNRSGVVFLEVTTHNGAWSGAIGFSA